MIIFWWLTLLPNIVCEVFFLGENVSFFQQGWIALWNNLFGDDPDFGAILFYLDCCSVATRFCSTCATWGTLASTVPGETDCFLLLSRTCNSVLAHTEWMGVIRLGYITQKQTFCLPILHAMYQRMVNPSGVVMGAIPTNKGPLGTPGQVGHQCMTSS